MLVLSRKVGESVHIGDGVKVTIVRLSNNAVRIGIDAPKDVPIARDDIKVSLRAVTHAESD